MDSLEEWAQVPYGEFFMSVYRYKFSKEFYGYIYFINGREPEEMGLLKEDKIEVLISKFTNYLLENSVAGGNLKILFADDYLQRK